MDGRRPSRVTFHDDLEADLARRDFTVNAMAWDPLSGELRDPHGGRADLARKLIRAVGDPRERFAEDGLRPLRGVRFVSQLGFRLAPQTRDAIPGALQVVALVSRERVAEELSRLLVGPHAAGGIAALAATGLLPVVLPRLAALPPARVRHALAVASEPFPAPRGAVPEEDAGALPPAPDGCAPPCAPAGGGHAGGGRASPAQPARHRRRRPLGRSLRARREGSIRGKRWPRGHEALARVGRARAGPALPRALEGRRPAPGGADGDAGRRGAEIRGQGGGRAPRRRAALGRRAGAGREGGHGPPPGNIGEGGRGGPAPPPRRGPGSARREHEGPPFRQVALLVGGAAGGPRGRPGRVDPARRFPEPPGQGGTIIPTRPEAPHHGPAHPLHRERPSLPRARPPAPRVRRLRGGRGIVRPGRHPAGAQPAPRPRHRGRPPPGHRRRGDRQPPEAGEGPGQRAVPGAR